MIKNKTLNMKFISKTYLKNIKIMLKIFQVSNIRKQFSNTIFKNCFQN